MPKKSEASKQVEEAKFVKAKLSGASNTQAALVANPNLTPKSAKNIGMRLSTKVDAIIHKTATQALEDAGLGIDDFIKTIKEAREANKIIVMGKGSDDSFVDVIPDWTARLKATEMGLKLLQAYTPVKPADDPPPQDVITPEFKKALKARDVKELQRIVFNSEDNTA